MTLSSQDFAKKKMQAIIDRVVVDDSCKKKLIDMLYMREKIFPLKGILYEMELCETLELTVDEKKLLNDLTAIYI